MLDYQRVLCSCFRYMNMNCVIFPSNLDSPLENWMDGKDNKLTSKYRARLKTCVDRALASSKRSDFRKRFPRCPKRIQKVFLEFLECPSRTETCFEPAKWANTMPLLQARVFTTLILCDFNNNYMILCGYGGGPSNWRNDWQRYKGFITFIEWLVDSFLVQLIQDSLVHWFIIDSFIHRWFIHSSFIDSSLINWFIDW